MPEDRHLHVRLTARDLLLGLEHARVLPGVIDNHGLAAADNIGLDCLTVERDRLGVYGGDELGLLLSGGAPERRADRAQHAAFEQVEHGAFEAKALADRARD